jgi:hypothetical protein
MLNKIIASVRGKVKDTQIQIDRHSNDFDAHLHDHPIHFAVLCQHGVGRPLLELPERLEQAKLELTILCQISSSRLVILLLGRSAPIHRGQR